MFRPMNRRPARKVKSSGKQFNPATGTVFMASDGHASNKKPVNNAPASLQNLQTSTPLRHIDLHPLQEYINKLSGLVTYHPMTGLDGTSVNQSPNNTNPAVAANITIGDGKVLKCYNFDGTSSAVQLSNLTFPSTDFSITFLVKRNGVQDANDRVVDYAAAGPSGGFTVVCPSGATSKMQLSIYNTVTPEAVINTDNDLTDNTWYLVTATYTANSAKFYLNSTQQGATDTSVTCSAPAAQSVTVGRRSTGATNFFKGSVQHLAIFNRVLTAQEITDLATLAGV